MANTDWGFFVDIESKEMLSPEQIVVFTVEYPKPEPEPKAVTETSMTITTSTRIHNKLCQFIILMIIFILTKIGCIKQ